jgi:hypothetical protein
MEGYTIRSDEERNESLSSTVKADRAVVDDHDLPEDPSGEFLPADPVYRRLHRAVRFDPESVWDELEAYLCAKKRGVQEADAQDLIEDLMFWHGDAFFDRVESLVGRCPSTREMVAWAVVEGVSGDGVARFHDLQQRLRHELDADRRKQRTRIRAALLAGLTTRGIGSALRALRRRDR